VGLVFFFFVFVLRKQRNLHHLASPCVTLHHLASPCVTLRAFVLSNLSFVTPSVNPCGQKFRARYDMISDIRGGSVRDREQEVSALARDLLARARVVSSGLSGTFAAVDSPARFPALYIPASRAVRRLTQRRHISPSPPRRPLPTNTHNDTDCDRHLHTLAYKPTSPQPCVEGLEAVQPGPKQDTHAWP
jgi:hypothetical protein